MTEELANRLAVLTRLVKISPQHDLGRTAMMKMAYFLIALRGVPLSYRFTLYSYGPFDSNVLSDVDMASSLGALRSSVATYENGSTYSIQPADGSDRIEESAKDFLVAHDEDIHWVVNEFGGLNAKDLELSSTIVYIDREADDKLTRDELAKRVRDVKPHFSTERILGSIQTLESKGLLTACC